MGESRERNQRLAAPCPSATEQSEADAPAEQVEYEKSFHEEVRRSRMGNAFKKVTKSRLEFSQRMKFSFLLMGSFALILAAGALACDLCVLTLTTIVYYEVSSLRQVDSETARFPLFSFLRVYCYVATILATAAPWVASVLEVPLSWASPVLAGLVSTLLLRLNALLYVTALLGLCIFIISLRRYSLKYQFTQFAIIIMSCLFVGSTFALFVKTIHTGMIWFMLSTSCVICNDSFAFFVGRKFGKTRLTRLSPNKTVEGFIGGFLVTLVWVYGLAYALSYLPFLACPTPRVSFVPFDMWWNVSCETTLFEPTVWYWGREWNMMPIQAHGLAFAFCASFIAPFGGLFASALKRALHIKDFGNSIPGHGGLTDRFDCQIVMSVATALYLQLVVGAPSRVLPSLGVLADLIRALSPHEKAQLLAAAGL